MTSDEIRRQSLEHVFPPRTPKGIVLAESGYLMIVKSFKDDLAWEVQRQLVNSYFRVEKGIHSVEALSPAVARQIGGMVKAVVHKQLEEALTQALPTLVHGELAKHNLSVRFG